MKNKTKDFSFNRYFDVKASPRTQIHFDKKTGMPAGFDYFPKHAKRIGKIVWDSLSKGAYILLRDGELAGSRKKVAKLA